ncbi:MAG: energy-coupling factor transporter ATPase [Actinomycetota bacterium]
MIKISNLTYTYNPGRRDQIIALHNVNLTIQPGEFVAILGSNGSGKSTLAKLLNGLLIPTSGEVSVENLSTNDPDNLWRIRQLVGMIFQNPENQIVATVVEEDVAFGPENLGLARDEIRRRVDRALSLVRMSRYARYEPHLLSAGQKQRVAIAGVLAMMPKYLVLDEPTSMLDPLGRKEIIEILKGLNTEHGVTVIHITHFPEEAVFANRLLIMEGGRIISDGCPREVFSDVHGLRHTGVTIPPMTDLARGLVKLGLKIPQSILTVDEMVDALCSLN